MKGSTWFISRILTFEESSLQPAWLQCPKLCMNKETRNKKPNQICDFPRSPGGCGPNLLKPHLFAAFIAIGNRDSGNTSALRGNTVLDFTQWRDGRLQSICWQRAELSEFQVRTRVFDLILQSEPMYCF